MAVITNNLSWSISRSELFNFCKRKYYFTYYESWGGWFSNADPRKQLAYFLKNRQQAAPWVGDVVHKAIKFTIQNFEKADEHYIKENLVKRLKYDYQTSLQYTKKTAKAKDLWLFEHYKGSSLDLEHYIEKAVLCVSNFFNSFLLDEIKCAAENKQVIYLDESDINKMLFQMGDIPTFAIPDLCFRREDGSVVIIDWKTGKSKEEELTPQLKLYASRLGIIDQISASEEVIEAYAYYLAEDELIGRQVTNEDIAEIEQTAADSFNGMKAMLKDVKNNVPDAEEKFEKSISEKKCEACVFKEICHI